MSSLKDWYRYVDSHARRRTEGDASPEQEPEPGEPAESRSSAPAGDPTVGEEELDVWSGLFSQRRKPEPKPTTAPLKRPNLRLDEVPPDLPFIREPIESPPRPQFPFPEGEVAVPSFDEFVSPFAPEPSPPLAAPPPGPVTSAQEPAPPAAEGDAFCQRPASVTQGPLPAASLPAGGSAPADPGPAVAREPAGPPSIPTAPSGRGPGAAGPVGDVTAVTTQGTPPGETSAAAMTPAEIPGPGASSPSSAPMTDDQLSADPVPPRSPSDGSGSGETASADAAGSQPEPVGPQANRSVPPPEDEIPVLESLGSAFPPEPPAGPEMPSRPVPGTEAWERERVERLARTFRETLHALEQSIASSRSGTPSLGPAVRQRREALIEPIPVRPAPAAPEAATDATAPVSTPPAGSAVEDAASPEPAPAVPASLGVPVGSTEPAGVSEPAPLVGPEALDLAPVAIEMGVAAAPPLAAPADRTAGDVGAAPLPVEPLPEVAAPEAAPGTEPVPSAQPAEPPVAFEADLGVEAQQGPADLPAEAAGATPAPPVVAPERQPLAAAPQGAELAPAAAAPDPTVIVTDGAAARDTVGAAAAAAAPAVPEAAVAAFREPELTTEPVAPDRPTLSGRAAPALKSPGAGRPSRVEAPPDVLRSIQEAALIRQRLPQHMAMLLRIPTNEVAQNSYKSPFRETREDLIRRLLDPQLTLEEAARVLGVCPTTVRRYTNRGMLHCHRTPGNQRRFRMSDVLQFLEQFGDRIDRAAEARQLEEAA